MRLRSTLVRSCVLYLICRPPFRVAVAERSTSLDLHMIYGPVVSTQPGPLSYAAAQAWKDIYGYTVNRPFTKKNYFRLRPSVQDLLTADYENHSRQRTDLHPAFSERSIKDREPIFMAYIDRLIGRMRQACNDEEPIDTTKWFESLAFDVVSELAFSAPFDCLKNSEYHTWAQLLRNFFKATTWIQNARLFGPIAPLLMLFAPFEDLRKGKDHVRMSSEKVQQRLERGEDPNRTDFWTYATRSNEEKGIYLTVPEMEIAGALMLPTRTETIATALCGALCYLSKSPDARDKLSREIDNAFDSESAIDMTTTARLTTLTATIKETLRLYTPFAGTHRRSTPSEGGAICGDAEPGNTSVGVSVLAAFHSPDNFSRPQTFAPERGLPTEERPAWAKDDILEACQPFSVGPRNCLGQTLAMSEIRVTLAKIIYHFTFELGDNAFNPERQRFFLVCEKGPLRIRLRSRTH